MLSQQTRDHKSSPPHGPDDAPQCHYADTSYAKKPVRAEWSSGERARLYLGFYGALSIVLCALLSRSESIGMLAFARKEDCVHLGGRSFHDIVHYDAMMCFRMLVVAVRHTSSAFHISCMHISCM